MKQTKNGKHILHWFRKGLRLHDNPSLKEALKGAASFRCVYILDPWFAGSSQAGINKWRWVNLTFLSFEMYNTCIDNCVFRNTVIIVGRVIDQTDESSQRPSTIWGGEKFKGLHLCIICEKYFKRASNNQFWDNKTRDGIVCWHFLVPDSVIFTSELNMKSKNHFAYIFPTHNTETYHSQHFCYIIFVYYCQDSEMTIIGSSIILLRSALSANHM